MEELEITETDKGIKIITQSMPHCRSVSIMIGIGVGSRHEPDAYAGISHFLEHMLFKGTERKPNHSLITQPVENTGGSLNASTGYDSTIYWCRVPREFLADGLELIFDMINNSIFRKADIVKERQVIIEELRASMDDPESLADIKLDELMWPGTPLGRDVAGNQYSISKITKENLTKYLKRNYVASNLVVSIAGCLDQEQAVNQVNRLSEEMSDSIPDDYLDLSINQIEPRVSITNCDTEQSHLSIGYPGTSWSSSDRYALDILSVILCEGMSSRLFTEVREKHGLAYDISGTTNHLRDVGSFTVSSGIDKTKIVSCVSLIVNNLEKCHKDIKNEEVRNAKKLMMGRYNLGVDDPQFIAHWNLNALLNNEKIYSYGRLEERIRSVKVEQIRESASRYLKREKLNLIIMGPHDKEMDILSGL